MNIIASYDSTLAAAPVGFQAGVQAACAFFDQTFSNNITVAITFSWKSLGAGGPDGHSSDYGNFFSYNQVVSALHAAAAGQPALTGESFPAFNPFGGGSLLVTNAEQKALGLGSPSGPDGAVTLSSDYAYSFDQTAVSAIDGVGVLEHEISEVLGRELGGDGSLSVEPFALFRYSSPGVIDTSSSYANAYFSVDGGATNLGQMGNANGDLADWSASISGDAFGSGAFGSAATITTRDMYALEALGYRNAGGNPGPVANNNALVLGSGGNDTILASNPRAFIYGAGGLDTITLAAGSQTVLLSAPGQGFVTIDNFKSGVDRLAVDMSFFGVTPGSYAFVSGPGANPATTAPTFFFDTTLGDLWFDSDGTGSHAKSLVASLPGVTSLAAGDLATAQDSFAANVSVVNTTPSSITYGEGPNETLWATGYNETLMGGPYHETFILQAAYENALAGDGGAFMAGLGGHDQMFGGAGADFFYFNSPKAGVDTIQNFSEAQGDRLEIQASAFAAFSGFQLTDGIGLVQGANPVATQYTATFLYDAAGSASAGYLWFEPLGTGSATKTLVAYLPGAPTLHAADLLMV